MQRGTNQRRGNKKERARETREEKEETRGTTEKTGRKEENVHLVE